MKLSQKDFNSVIIPPKIAGIKANLPMFNLAWQINDSFSMNLACSLDWEKEILESATPKSLHQHYFDHFEDVELNWHLLKNKGSESWFFQTKPLFDYLLICNGDDIYDYFGRAVQAIRLNQKIEFIHPFEFKQIKSKDIFFNNILNTRLFIEDLNHVQE